MTQPSLPLTRFVGIDIGTRSIMVTAVDSQQQIVLQPKKIPVDRFDAWARQNIHQSDAVVFEATSSAWQYYDQLALLATKVVVAKAQAVKALAAARVKTDARDAVALARLLAVGMIPAVWVPPPAVRELRALIAHRQRLVQQRTRAKNRLQGLILAHRLLPPEGNPFADANRS